MCLSSVSVIEHIWRITCSEASICANDNLPNSFSMISRSPKYEISIIIHSPSCWLSFLFHAAFFAFSGRGWGREAVKLPKQIKQNHKSTIKILMNRVRISWNVNDIKDLWFSYDAVCEKLLVFWHNTTWFQKTLEDDLYDALLSLLELHSSSLPFTYAIRKMEIKKWLNLCFCVPWQEKTRTGLERHEVE